MATAGTEINHELWKEQYTTIDPELAIIQNECFKLLCTRSSCNYPSCFSQCLLS